MTSGAVARPMPVDFMSVAQGMSVEEMCLRWDCGRRIAKRWRKESGITFKAHSSRIPRPSRDVLQRLTDTMSQEEAAHELGVNTTTFRKMQKEAGIVTPHGRTFGNGRKAAERDLSRIKLPDGFLDYMADHSQEAAADHYGVNISTIQRWCRLTGFKRTTPLVAVRKNAPPPDWWEREAPNLTRDEACLRASVGHTVIARWTKETGVRCKPCVGITFGRRHKPQPVRVDMSLAGRAADYLRPRWPSYRCDQDGRQDINGTHWRFGSAVLSADEVVERAERRGFDPRAWERIAA